MQGAYLNSKLFSIINGCSLYKTNTMEVKTKKLIQYRMDIPQNICCRVTDRGTWNVE
jgi:hypothetical protein